MCQIYDPVGPHTHRPQITRVASVTCEELLCMRTSACASHRTGSSQILFNFPARNNSLQFLRCSEQLKLMSSPVEIYARVLVCGSSDTETSGYSDDGLSLSPTWQIPSCPENVSANFCFLSFFILFRVKHVLWCQERISVGMSWNLPRTTTLTNRKTKLSFEHNLLFPWCSEKEGFFQLNMKFCCTACTYPEGQIEGA